MADDLERIEVARMTHEPDHMVMQFDTLSTLRKMDNKGVFPVRVHGGAFNFCGIPVREDIRVPFETVIFEKEGKEVGRIVGIGAAK